MKQISTFFIGSFVLVLTLLFSTPAKASMTFVVNTAGDANDGVCHPIHCTLREAVYLANSTPEMDFIYFSQPMTIVVGRDELVVTSPVTIDATTVDGYVGVPRVRIDGNNYDSPDLFHFQTGSEGSVVRGLSMTRFGRTPVYITTGNITIEQNYIGTDGYLNWNYGNGTSGDTSGGGIVLWYVAGSDPVTIQQNVIVSNEYGIRVQDSGHFTIQYNWIGTTPTGLQRYGNAQDGIHINGTVGGSNHIEANVISGNGDDGINVSETTGSITITGNMIGGSQPEKPNPLGNTNAGIKMVHASNQTISDNTIINNREGIWFRSNGTKPVSGNLVQGNWIGTTKEGVPNLGNRSGGIKFTSSTSKTPIEEVNMVIENVIAHNTFGLFVSLFPGTAVEAHENCILHHRSRGIVNASPDTLNATGNYYGAADGPGGDGPGSGDRILAFTAPITYAPFNTTSLSESCALSAEYESPTPQDPWTPWKGPYPAHDVIIVNAKEGASQFYNRGTQSVFRPRGHNYIRLADRVKPNGDLAQNTHVTFDVDYYDPGKAEISLYRMSLFGYDTVRVFLSFCCDTGPGDTVHGGISTAYMENVVDFLQRADRHNIYVMFTMDWLPPAEPYGSLLDSTNCCGLFAGFNANYLTLGGIQANQLFWHDFIRTLIEMGAPMHRIFSYQIRNEFLFSMDNPPFSLPPIDPATGHHLYIETALGEFDMADPREVEIMMIEGMVFFLDEVARAIRDIDPEGLVSVGYFAPQAPGPGDPRRSIPAPAIHNSMLDFVDIHIYPEAVPTLPTLLDHINDFGITPATTKPIIIGEFGAFRFSFRNSTLAASVLRDWQIESCDYGIDGWLVWTWDTWEQPELYPAIGIPGTGDGPHIEHELAPIHRPDPCV